LPRRLVIDPRSINLWNANIRRLRSVQPALSARLEALAEQRSHAFEYKEYDESEVTVTGTSLSPQGGHIPPLPPLKRGVWVAGEGYSPFFQSTAFPPLPWRNADEAAGSVLFIYGTGVAPWLHTVLRSLPEAVASVVVIEPSLDLLACALHSVGGGASGDIYGLVRPSCRLAFVSSRQDVLEAMEYAVMGVGTYVAARLGVYCHPGETAAREREFSELDEEIRSQIIIRLYRLGNSMEDTLLGMRQIALNAPWIALGHSLSDIGSVYAGRPFIWVASGPSLEKNFRLLKDNRDRAVIVCADTAASKLLSDGIMPHAVVALERGGAVRQYLERLCVRFPDEAKKILLVSQAVCAPEVAGKWPGPVVVVGKAELALDSWAVGAVLGGSLLVSGLSVAHMGIWLAASLGASSIALVGQDLAYAPDGESHASGTVNASAARIEKSHAAEGAVLVPGALGGVVETHGIWRLFLSMMEEHIPMLRRPVFDCTEGGALIRGTIVMPLEIWMKEHLNIAPFDLSPAEAVLRVGAVDAKGRAEEVALRAKAALKSLTNAEIALDALAHCVSRVAAPAITEARRRSLADEVYAALDAFHEGFPVMDVIGQSVGGTSAAAILRNRRLNDVPTVKAWREALDGLISSYRTALRFMEGQLRAAAGAVTAMASQIENADDVLSPLPFCQAVSAPLDGEFRAAVRIDGLKDALREGSSFLLDNLLARADHKWWGFWGDEVENADWRAARVLAGSGRFTEAVALMERFERTQIGVFGIGEREKVRFYREMAEMLAAHDLCRETDWGALEAALTKAGASEKELAACRIGREQAARVAVESARSSRGSFFSDVAPRYVKEDMLRLVDEVSHLAAAATYHKRMSAPPGGEK
jgi:hypothetical protein